MRKSLLSSFLLLSLFVSTFFTFKQEAFAVTIGEQAPIFELYDQDGKLFKLQDQMGKGWTIIYFYPKSFTPGCTEQACTYNDSLEQITELGGTVYGISSDDVKKQKEFQEKYHLTFTLLADPHAKVIKLYGVKMPIVSYAKRWTFIIDNKLIVRKIFKNVDTSEDANEVINFIKNNTH